MTTRSSADSIEQYAALCARLDDAFPDRATILRSANLDEGSFRALQARWIEQLIAPDGGALADTFGAAYSAARRGIVDQPALPFRSARTDEDSGLRLAPAPCRIHEPPIRPAVVANDAPGSTEEMPIFARRPPVLPFAAPHVPFRRLHRFDTQTGLPLRDPIWIEDAPAPAPYKPR